MLLAQRTSKVLRFGAPGPGEAETVLLLRVVGVVLVLIGVIWLIQGLGIVTTGSFMDGQSVWAVIGGACVAGGLVVLSRSRRRRT